MKKLICTIIDIFIIFPLEVIKKIWLFPHNMIASFYYHKLDINKWDADNAAISAQFLQGLIISLLLFKLYSINSVVDTLRMCKPLSLILIFIHIIVSLVLTACMLMSFFYYVCNDSLWDYMCKVSSTLIEDIKTTARGK